MTMMMMTTIMMMIYMYCHKSKDMLSLAYVHIFVHLHSLLDTWLTDTPLFKFCCSDRASRVAGLNYRNLILFSFQALAYIWKTIITHVSAQWHFSFSLFLSFYPRAEQVHHNLLFAFLRLRHGEGRNISDCLSVSVPTVTYSAILLRLVYIYFFYESKTRGRSRTHRQM